MGVGFSVGIVIVVVICLIGWGCSFIIVVVMMLSCFLVLISRLCRLKLELFLCSVCIRFSI